MTFDATRHCCCVCPSLQTGCAPGCSPAASRSRARTAGSSCRSIFQRSAPPPFPNRRVHSGVSALLRALRRSAATPPECSDLVDSHHPAGLLLDDPVRTVAAAHGPGVHPRFIQPADDARFHARRHGTGIPGMPVCPSKLSLRGWPSRQMSESALSPTRFSAPVRGGSLLLPGCHLLCCCRAPSVPFRVRPPLPALKPRSLVP